MSSDLTRLLQDAAPDPEAPLDPEALWSVGRARHRRRRRITVAAAVLVIAGCSAPWLTRLDGGDSGPTVTADATQSRAPTKVEALAATDPLDLIADLGDFVDWHPRYGAEAGVPVTEENAVDAYGARIPLAELEKRGWISAATQEWRYGLSGSDTGWSNIRITVSRFASLEAGDVKEAWTDAPVDRVDSPEGIKVTCTTNATDVSEEYYAGAYYQECNVTIGDSIWISIASISPIDGNASINEILGPWLAGTPESPD